MEPAGEVPPQPAVPQLLELRVEDERGPIPAPQAQKKVEQIDRAAGGQDLLERHLAQVDEVVAAPLVLGNDAHLLIDGPRTKDAMFDAMAKARRSIDLQSYILEPEGSGERLLEIVEKRRPDGVAVRVMYDSVGSMNTPDEYFDKLRALGAAVCEFNPVNPLEVKGNPELTINNRDHRKILVVDTEVAFTGGINISGVYSAGSFGSQRKSDDPEEGWRDTHVEVRGPIVAGFQSLFDETWTDQACEPAQEARSSPPPERAGDMAMRVVTADPTEGRSELYVALLSALENASERAWLTYAYFVPDEQVVKALVDAAQRGVDVRLALPGFSDFWAPFHAGRSHYDDLMEAGVRIFERHDALLHAKTAVIDGVWSSVGSTNLDWRSFVHNYEADVLVLDASFAREMEDLFKRDVEASEEVQLNEWKRRGLRPRFLEWFARRWEYLL